MAKKSDRRPVGGGGAATSAGITFQQQVGAFIGSWLLTQSGLDQRFGLGHAKPLWIRFETEAPVDDILVATSAGGFIAIQAKTSVSRSRDLLSPFGKTVSQFVRHWLACEDGDGSLHWNRPLDPQIDRLVLVVGRQAPSSIREQLSAALRLRSQPGGGELTDAQQRAFEDFEACVQQAWSQATTADYEPKFARTLAEFVKVVTFDPVGQERQAIVTTLAQTVPESVSAAVVLPSLEAICAELMAERGGIDLRTLRQKLLDRGIPLLSQSDFRNDIEKLRAHSRMIADTLEKYEIIETAEDVPISVIRECQTVIHDAAMSGPLLIVGEPGAGKSGVLNALARELRTAGKDVLELAVDRYSVETLEGLKNELGLDHGLIDVLDAWDGAEPGWIIVDALDATRGGKGEGVFRSLIEQVMEREGRWQIIASIRTFDLRMGQQFRLLFKGSPPVADLQEQGLQAVRHVRVPSWSETEFQQLLKLAPALATALENAPPALRELATVPFNTRLISDLVKDGSVTTDFSQIESQAELLQLYWEHRVEAHGAPAQASILRITEAMVDARALRASFAVAAGSDASVLDDLEREGVLISVDNRRWMQFRHHLLFDYAAARVLLDPDALIAGKLKFSKANARGLMLAPALKFVLREVWELEPSRAPFWAAAAHLLADREGDPVIRSATGRICAEYPSFPDDMMVLAQRIVSGDELAAQALIHAGGALAIRLEDHPATPLLPWAHLVQEIAPNVAPVSGILRFLLFQMIDRIDDSTERSALGAASRALLAYALALEIPRNLVSSAIGLVADTYKTDPAASRALLERIFEAERLNAFGFEEVPAICRKIEEIASVDPAFGERIYAGTYAYEVTEQRETMMGDSQILSLRSNARQDYDMARYSLGEFISKFLDMYPEHAISAIIQAVEAHVSREHPLKAEMLNVQIQVGEIAVGLREDWSHVWAHDPDSSYGHDAEALVKKLLEYLRSGSTSVVTQIAKRLIANSSLAVFWSRLFLAASERKDTLIDIVLPIAMCEEFLILPDTRKDAIDVLAAGYDRLSIPQKEAFESAVAQFDFSHFQRPDAARASFERRLFGSIGSGKLATPQASGLAEQLSDIDDVQNDRLFSVRSSFGSPEPFHWIQDLDHDLPANKRLMAAINRTKDVLGIESEAHDGSDVSLDTSLDAMDALSADIDRASQNAHLIIYAEGQITRGIQSIIERKLVPSLDDESVTARFLRLFDLAAASDGPPVQDDTEASFEQSASWGSPAPRVDAAEAALDLTLQRSDLYQRLEPTIEALLRDRHPAVRLQAAQRLVRIWDLDREGFWRRLSDRLESELNQSVIDHVASSVLGRVLHGDPDRAEPLVLALLTRFPGDAGRQARMRDTIADLLAILWVTYERPTAHAILKDWIADAASYHSELNKILGTLRGAFVAGLSAEPSNSDDGLRHRSQSLAFEIVKAANVGLEAYFRLETPSEPQQAQGRDYAQLLDAVCRELFFASGAGRDSSKANRAIEPDALAVFFDEVDPILEAIGDFATPHTVYYLLQLLEFLLPVNPARAFDLTAHALRSGGQRTGYQFESMGAELLVRLVGVFLADHKELFEDETRRTALIDCLEIFMDAGWPAARRLLYRLPELIQ